MVPCQCTKGIESGGIKDAKSRGGMKGVFPSSVD